MERSILHIASGRKGAEFTSARAQRKIECTRSQVVIFKTLTKFRVCSVCYVDRVTFSGFLAVDYYSVKHIGRTSDIGFSRFILYMSYLFIHYLNISR